MEENKEIYPKIHIVFPKVSKTLGRLASFFTDQFHHSPSHGDHYFEHPLDKPLEPVTDWPLESDGLSEPPEI